MGQVDLRVRRDVGGRLWVVAPGDDGADVLATRPTKKEAVALAVDRLASSQDGGWLRVHYGDGRLEVERFVTSADGDGPSESPFGVFQRIHGEGEKLDKGLDVGTKALAVAALLGVPGLSALISPEVRDAAGDGWFAVLLATFTWTVGCALSVVVGKKSGLAGWPLVSAVVACFVVALLFAGFIGHGVLDVEAEVQTAGNPIGIVLAFAEVAIRTYGPLGALLGLGMGIWLGIRVAPLAPDNFLD